MSDSNAAMGSEMQDQSSCATTWPEQDAVYKWLERMGLSFPHYQLHSLLEGVTETRLQRDRENDSLREQLAARQPSMSARDGALQLARDFERYANAAKDDGAAIHDPKWAEGRAAAYRRCAKDAYAFADTLANESPPQGCEGKP